MRILSRLRTAALGAASGAGIFSVVRSSNWRRRQLCILCYHGISLADEHEWRPGLYLTRQQFAGRIERLQALGANVLPLGEGLRRLREGSLPEAAVAITFDDGGHDFHVNALPLLEAAGLPATVYLTTYYSSAGVPIYSLAVDYLLWRARDGTFPAWPALGVHAPVSLDVAARRLALTDTIVAATRGASFTVARREAILDELAERLGEDMNAMRRAGLLGIMPADEVADCARRGIDFQLHTHRHRTPRDRALFLRELTENRDIIRRLSGADPVHFCYPSGDYTPSVFPWLAEAGVVSGTTCDVALATAKSHPYILPRFLDTSSQSVAAFDGWVTGAAAFVSRRSRAPSLVPA